MAEGRQAQALASDERQKKLQELYDTQRKRVEVNLRRKQKKREDYAKSLASGVHIYLHNQLPSSVSKAWEECVPPSSMRKAWEECVPPSSVSKAWEECVPPLA